MIADRPQTIVWAFTLSSRTSIWRFMAIWPSVECLFSITPVPRGPGARCLSFMLAACHKAKVTSGHGLTLAAFPQPDTEFKHL